MQSDKELAEVGRRIQAGWGAWKKLTGANFDRREPLKLNGRLYKVVIRPALLYGMGTVLFTKGQIGR